MAVTKASQNLIPIKEIRDDVVVMKNGSLRMVLMASAMNFALKSTDEQAAIIMQYQNFLNSLDFSLQIFIHSRSLNIEPYLETLKARSREQTNELLKIQMREYIDFVKEFVSATSIVNKSFYVVVPYAPAISVAQNAPSFLNIFGGAKEGQKTAGQTRTQINLEEHKIQLQQRVDTVIQGLARIGLRSVPLNTEELIELFFRLYNPSEMESSKIPQN